MQLIYIKNLIIFTILFLYRADNWYNYFLLVLCNIQYTKTVSFTQSKSKICLITSQIWFKVDGSNFSIPNFYKVQMILYSHYSIWKRLEKSRRLCRDQKRISSSLPCSKIFHKDCKNHERQKKVKRQKNSRYHRNRKRISRILQGK